MNSKTIIFTVASVAVAAAGAAAIPAAPFADNMVLQRGMRVPVWGTAQPGENVTVAQFQMDRSVMGEKYWRIWNEKEQARIDADIEANRKADMTVEVGAPDGTEVRYEQISHEFRFGASTFNFGQLGSSERNRRYAAAFGEGGVFNQGTVPFYWREYEPEPGVVRAHPAARTSCTRSCRSRKSALRCRSGPPRCVGSGGSVSSTSARSLASWWTAGTW